MENDCRRSRETDILFLVLLMSKLFWSRIPVRDAPVSGMPVGNREIRLSIRKPKNWRISLTTSASSASIAIPRVTLTDDRSRILIDTSAPEKCRKMVSFREGGEMKRSSNIPTIKKNKSVKRPDTAGRNERDTSGMRKSNGDTFGGSRIKKAQSPKATSEMPPRKTRNNGDCFPEAKGEGSEGPGLTRGASEIIRSGNRKGRNDPPTCARRSRRRFVSSRDAGMGSNVSRHSGKGLSGRRTQSSGNLCNGAKILAPSVNKILNSCGARGVSTRDRNKFCGSLPNHLDEKEVRSGECTPETLYNVNNNYADVYIHPSHGKNVELLFHKLAPPQSQQDFSLGDQGYGSERSPEEELPPSLLAASEPPSRHYSTIRRNKFSFITKENTFEARLEKGTRGLGLSVTGGIDTSEKLPGLIRIKRIFPNQPAWECNILQVGDVLLAANGIPLSGLTNYEALEVLRTTPNDVVLKVCRPPGDIFCIPPPGPVEPPPPPRRDPAHVISSSQLNASEMLPLPQLVSEPYEFEIVLKKVNGSLGFMLRKEDESVLGHCVRALVREPALSDGRIRPGDKIVTVNGVDISPMSHEEAVMYLRQCGEEVSLRLYRDPAQTPVSALSPTESCKTFRPKPALRKEAMDMLCDLAVKKLSPSDSSSSSGRSRLRGSSPGSSPRRRKLKKTPSEEPEEKLERPNFLNLGDGAAGSDHSEPAPEEDADSVLTGTSGSEVTQISVGNGGRAYVGSDECNSEDGAFPEEPASMPPLSTSSSAFSYKNPAYQSAHPTVHSESESSGERLSDQDIPDKVFGDGGGSQGLLKWKGILFTPEDGVSDPVRRKNHSKKDLAENEEILTVELCRGWNSRLGFSLQSSGNGTCVSAIYADSVAAKDGRLQLGDQVIMINDESTEDMPTSDVIDLLRKVRGSIAITVSRKRKDRS